MKKSDTDAVVMSVRCQFEHDIYRHGAIDEHSKDSNDQRQDNECVNPT
jgi:hypothetical protein